MEQNIVEDLVIPEVPKVIPNQEMYVYVPVATYKSKGIANFDSVTLNISNGTVSVKTLFVDGMIDNRIVQVTGQNSDKVISQKAITDLLEEKASKNEISEIAKEISEVTAESVAKETAKVTAEETVGTIARETAETVARETAEVYVDDNAAYSLEFSVDNSTFILTATLKNANGEILGTPQTVDLPLESVVVNGSYDGDTKSIILTLQNGNTVDIPIPDLIDGLASKAELDKKLDKPTPNIDYPVVPYIARTGSQEKYFVATNAAASTIPLRDSGGRLAVGTPLYSTEAANKDYVDNSLPSVISEDMVDSLF